jgi:hypothetical protein
MVTGPSFNYTLSSIPHTPCTAHEQLPGIGLSHCLAFCVLLLLHVPPLQRAEVYSETYPTTAFPTFEDCLQVIISSMCSCGMLC